MGAFCVYPDKYRPRRPKNNPLHRLLDSHYEEFRHVYDERFSRHYGFLRPVTDEVVDKYLRCGDPHYGFARIRCKECGAEYLRAFSCKCRGFCTSCSKRKSLDLSVFLEEELFRPVQHRHWVWGISNRKLDFTPSVSCSVTMFRDRILPHFDRFRCLIADY